METLPENETASLAQPKLAAMHGTFLPAVLIGLAVAVATMVLSYFIPLLAGLVDSSLVNLGPMIGIVSAIIAFLLYGLILVTPSVWFGVKRGWKAAIAVIAFEVIWLIILAFLIGLLLPSQYGPYEPNPFPADCPTCATGVR